jgi:hypothetical protein
VARVVPASISTAVTAAVVFVRTMHPQVVGGPALDP